jgi:hypothetical protein
MSFLKSCQYVLKAASNNIGGKKTRNTISGLSSRSGKEGTKPMINPTTTSNMG